MNLHYMGESLTEPEPKDRPLWRVLRCKPASEFAVIKHLEQLHRPFPLEKESESDYEARCKAIPGVPAYLPLTREEKPRPLFPGYVFAQFDQALRNRVLWSRNVLSVLRAEGEDQIVTEQEIAMIRELEQREATPVAVSARAGSAVEFKLAGNRIDGKYVASRNEKVAVIEIEMLGRRVHVPIAKRDIVRVFPVAVPAALKKAA